MLVLSRQRNESVMIGDDILVTVVDIRGDKIRLGISAPEPIPVHRKEVYDDIRREMRAASSASGASQVKPEDGAGRSIDPGAPPAGLMALPGIIKRDGEHWSRGDEVHVDPAAIVAVEPRQHSYHSFRPSQDYSVLHLDSGATLEVFLEARRVEQKLAARRTGGAA